MKKIGIVLILVANSLVLYAQTAQEILDKADAMFKLDKVYSKSTMTVFRSGKPDPAQTLEGYSQEKEGKDYSLTIILAPQRVKGTAYLQIEDDLWVRFSSTGRVRKLSSSAKKGSASGSDFSYSDIGEGNKSFTAKYSAVLDGTEKIEGTECFRIVFQPKAGAEDTYEKLVGYISKDEYRYIRIDYYESGARIKYLTLSNYKQVGDYLYPYKMVMKSLVSDSESVMTIDYMEYDSEKVQDRYFTTDYLETIQ